MTKKNWDNVECGDIFKCNNGARYYVLASIGEMVWYAAYNTSGNYVSPATNTKYTLKSAGYIIEDPLEEQNKMIETLRKVGRIVGDKVIE